MSYIVSAVYETSIAASDRRRSQRGVRFISVVTIVLLASLFTVAAKGQSRARQLSAQAGGELPGKASRQIEVLLDRKEQRTPAQRKMSSQLLDAWRAAVAAGREATGAATVDELVTVDIRADVTPAVLARIRALGGTVINNVPRYRSIRARLPVAVVEPLAMLDEVRSIRFADEAATRGLPARLPSDIRTDTTGDGAAEAGGQGRGGDGDDRDCP